jgi:hypothetical protein
MRTTPDKVLETPIYGFVDATHYLCDPALLDQGQ